MGDKTDVYYECYNHIFIRYRLYLHQWGMHPQTTREYCAASAF